MVSGILKRFKDRKRPRKADFESGKPIVFEMLEPRLLLSADLSFAAFAGQSLDLTLRMEDSRQEIQIIDNTDQSVLQGQALAETRAVSIEGADQEDKLTVDFKVLFSLPEGITFTDSSDSDNDTLEVIGQDNLFKITGENEGNVNDAIDFTGIESLIGGAGTDTYKFAGVGSIKGTIDGASGGFDVVEVQQSNYDVVAFNYTGSGSGSIELDGAIISSYSRMETITLVSSGRSPPTDVAINISTAAPDEFTLRDDWIADNGIITIDSTNETLVDTTFEAPTGSLTINSGSGGDVITVDVLEPGFDLFINGQAGQDTIIGQDSDCDWNITGTDSGSVAGAIFTDIENLTGGSGADTFIFADGGEISGVIDGGWGINTLDYSAHTTDVTVDLSAGTATGTGGVSNIQSVIGGSGDDTLTGDSAANILIGGAGNDLLIGGLGGDTLDGGEDEDRLEETRDASFILTDAALTVGSEDTDALSDIEEALITGGSGPNTLNAYGFSGLLTFSGGEDDDILIASSGTSNFAGGPGDDTLTANDLANLWEITGPDTGRLNGGVFTEVEQLFGGAVADTFAILAFAALISKLINGRSGDDKLKGGNGANLWAINLENGGTLNSHTFIDIECLIGGTDTDDFVFSEGGSIDTIAGGVGGYDTVEVQGIYDEVTFDYTGPDSGDIQLRGGIISSYSMMEAILVTSSGRGPPTTVTINALAVASDEFTLRDEGTADNGIITINNTNGTFAETTFEPPTGSLTINSGPGSDIITVELLEPSFDLFINGQAGNDTLIGPAVNTTWNITGANAGKLNGKSFIDIENLIGGAGSDAFVFSDGAGVTGTVDGGAGSDTLDFSADTAGITVDLGAGTATGSGGISNINNILGGAGEDTLVGPAADSTWNITGADAGDVEGVIFAGIENLTGAAGNQDTFVFHDGGSISGTVEGGDAGFDTIEIAGGSYDTITFNYTGFDSGDIQFGDVFIYYSGMEPIIADSDGTLANAIFNMDDDPQEFIIRNDTDHAGKSELHSPTSDFETTEFDNPTTKLDVNSAGGADDITIEALDAGFIAALNVFAGTGGDIINVTAVTGGGVYTIKGEGGEDQITVNDIGDKAITLEGGSESDTYILKGDFGDVIIKELGSGGTDDTIDFSQYAGTISVSYDGPNIVFTGSGPGAPKVTLSPTSAANIEVIDDDGKLGLGNLKEALLEGLNELVNWARGLAQYGDLGNDLPIVTGKFDVNTGNAIDVAETFNQLRLAVQGFFDGNPTATTQDLANFLSTLNVSGLKHFAGSVVSDIIPTLGVGQFADIDINIVTDSGSESININFEGGANLEEIIAKMMDELPGSWMDSEGLLPTKIAFTGTNVDINGNILAGSKLVIQSVPGSGINEFTVTANNTNAKDLLGLVPTRTVSALIPDLGNLNITGGLPSVPGDLIQVVKGPDNIPELKFNFDFSTSRATNEFGIDLGEIFRDRGLYFAADARVNMAATLGAELGLGLKLSSTPEFFLDVGSVDVTANTSAVSGVDINVGFLGATVTGDIDLDAELTANFSGRISLSDMTFDILTDISGIAQMATSLDLSLAVDADGLGFPGPHEVTIALSGKDIFIPSGFDEFSDFTITPSFSDLENLFDFNRISASSVVSLLNQLGNILNNVKATDLFKDLDFPFGNTNFSKILDFADTLSDALLIDDNDTPADNLDDVEKLLDKNGQPTFLTAQALETKLASLPGMSGLINAIYNAGTKELTYNIDIGHTLADIEVPIDFDLDLSPLGGVSSNSSVTLTVAPDLTLRFGFKLGDDLSAGLTDLTPLASLNGGEGVDIKTLPALTLPNAPRTIYGVLNGDAQFTLKITDNTPSTTEHVVRIFAAQDPSVAGTEQTTEDNTTIGDLISDINWSLGETGVAGVTAVADGDRVKLNATDASLRKLEIVVSSGDPAINELGFQASMTAERTNGTDPLFIKTLRDVPAVVGRLTSTAIFNITMDDAPGEPVTVTVLDGLVDGPTSTNRNIFDLVNDLQNAINDTSLAGRIEVSAQGDKLVLTSTDSIGFSMQSASELGLPADDHTDLDDLVIYTRNGAQHTVSLDGATNLGDVFAAIAGVDGTNGDVTASVNDAGTGIKLVDNTGSGSTLFRVESINLSRAAAELGIFKADETADQDDDGDVDGEDGDGIIEGTQLSGLTLLDRFFIENATIGADFDLTTPVTNITGIVIDDSYDSKIKSHDLSTDHIGQYIDINASAGFNAGRYRIVSVVPDDGDPTLFIATLDGDAGDLNQVGGSGVLEGIQASANFGFVGIALVGSGYVDGRIEAGFDSGGRLTLNDIIGTLGDIADGTGNITDIVDAPTFTSGSTPPAQLTMGVELYPSFPDIVLGGTPQVTVGISNLADFMAGDLSSLQVNTSGFDDLDFFDDISFTNILAALQELTGFLSGFEEFGFLETKIPLINLSVNDLLGFVDRFTTAVDEVENNPAGSIQYLTTILEGAFGLDPMDNLVDLNLVNDAGGQVLRFDLDLHKEYSDSLGVEIPIVDEGILAALGQLNLVTLTGSAGLSATGNLDIDLDFGIDLNTFDLYLFDTTGIGGDLTLAGDSLSFRAAVGPFGLFIKDGTASIGASFSAGIAAGVFTNNRVLLTDIFSGGILSSVETSLSGPVDVDLPTYFPTESIRTRDSENPDLPGSIILSGDLTNIGDIEFRLPELTIDLSKFSLFDNILLAVDGMDQFLLGLQNILDGEIFGIELPLIGDKLSEGARFIEDFRKDFVEPFREEVEKARNTLQGVGNPDRNFISEFIFDILGPNSSLNLLKPLPGADLAVKTPGDYIDLDTNLDEYLDPNNMTVALEDLYIEWDFELGDVYTASTDIGFDIGLPWLGLETEGDIELNFDWALDFGFGISFAEGVYLLVDGPDDLTVDLNVGFSPGTQITGNLGFLQLTAMNKDLGRGGTGLEVYFHLDIENDLGTTRTKPDMSEIDIIGFSELGSLGVSADFGASAAVELGLDLSIAGYDGFPSLSSDFVLWWGFSTSDLAQGNFFEQGLQLVEFQNITLDMGTYVSKVLGPIVGEVQKVTKPIQPVIDVITAPIPVISDLAGSPVTLLDLALLYAGDAVNPGLIYAIADIIELINRIDASSGDSIPINFGDFTVYEVQLGSELDDWGYPIPILSGGNPISLATMGFGDLTNSNFNINSIADAILGSNDILNQVGSTINDLIGAVIGEGGGTGAASIFEDVAGGAVGGFSFPLLDNPTEVFGLFMGKNPTLVRYDMAPLDFEFEYSQFFSIFGPLGASINATIGIHIDLHYFGYDTYGIRRFADTGFRNPLKLVDGFFISDLDDSGKDASELVFEGGVYAAAELNLVVAKGGVAGGVFIEVNFDLFDPDRDGKIRLVELANNFRNEVIFGSPALAPLAIFDVHGEVFAKLFAFVEVDLFILSFSWSQDITPPVTLLEFSTDFFRPPVLASEVNGDLQLHIGPFSKERLNGDLTDGSEVIHAKQGSGPGKVLVWSEMFGISESNALEYNIDPNNGKIIAIGGEGDDVIDLDGITNANITYDIEGGVGNDEIWAGAGAAVIKGGSGDDEIHGGNDDVGGKGDIIYGDTGNDKIYARGGQDIVFGDSGIISGKTVRSTVGITDGEDYIEGGDGGDILFGSGDEDEIYGDGGGDIIFGDPGRVNFASDATVKVAANATFEDIYDTELGRQGFNDELHGDAGEDMIYGGFGNDGIYGGANTDTLFGEGGFDTIYGEGEADIIFGDGWRVTEVEAVKVLRPTSGGSADTIFGGLGGDTIWAGGGSDYVEGGGNSPAVDEIHGGDSADTLYGDGTSAGGDDGEDLIYGEGGPDTIYGGGDVDTLIGGDAADVVYGEYGPVDYHDLVTDLNLVLEGQGLDAYIRAEARAGKVRFVAVSDSVTDFTIEAGPGDSGGYAEFNFGAGIQTMNPVTRFLEASLSFDSPLGRLTSDAQIRFNVTLSDASSLSDVDVDLTTGDTGDNEFIGEDIPVSIGGNGGNDTIVSGIGNDIIDGQAGSDLYFLRLRGGEAEALIQAVDTGGLLTDTDVIRVFGTPFNDQFLLRASSDPRGPAFVAMINSDVRVERINYRNLERMQVNGSLGDDRFHVDDVRTETTLNGELGEDFFQVGQLYRSMRTPQAANVSVEDVFTTIETTRGWLSNGISQPMTINGGPENDNFVVFHNKAVLTLNGEDGDDTFLIKAFALAGSQEPQRERTDVSGGSGTDLIQYAVNAPVNIDGGDGLDTVIIIGTEFGDDFVITEYGVFGAGLNVNFVNIESLEVDGAEGADRFYVLSTSDKFITRISGGLGTDTFNMSGPTPPVISNDLLGHSGVIAHSIESTDLLYDDLKVEGISANVADNDEPAIRITPSIGSTIVSEAGGFDSYTIVLTQQPIGDVFIKALGPLQSPTDEELEAKAIRVYSEAPGSVNEDDGTATTLRFTPGNWNIPQTVKVEAFDDDAIEGERTAFISHIVLSPSTTIEGMVDSVTIDPVIVILAGIEVPTVTLTDADPSTGPFPTASEGLRGGQLLITEGAGTGQVRLIKENTADVLTLFGEWHPDLVPDGTSAYIIRRYDGLALPSLQVKVYDDDGAGVQVSEADGQTQLIEDGASDDLEIVLTRDPDIDGSGTGTDVTVTLNSFNDQISFSSGVMDATTTLTFTDGDWDLPQSVTLYAWDDTIREHFHHGLIRYTVSGELDFTPPAVTDAFDIVDQFGLEVGPRVSVGLSHKPKTTVPADFTVLVEVGALNSSYLTDDPVVTVGVTDFNTLKSDFYKVISNKLVFLEADESLLFIEGKIRVTYEYKVPGFEGLFVPPILPDIADNDVPGVLVTQTGGSTDVIEARPTDRVMLGGNVSSAAVDSLTDDTLPFTPDMVGDLVRIVAGEGKGQTREISAVLFDGAVLVITSPWDFIPDNTSIYEIVSAGTPEHSGVVESAGSDTLTDTSATFPAVGAGLRGYHIKVTDAGDPTQIQERTIVSNTGDSVTVDRPWEVPLEAGDTYEIFYAGVITAGTVDFALANLLGDLTGPFPTDGDGLKGHFVRIVSGPGAGQDPIRILSNTDTELTLESDWDDTPDGTSEYEVIADFEAVPWSDTYEVVLASQPTDDVEITVTPKTTKTSRGRIVYLDYEQVKVFSETGVDNGDGTITLTFTTANWDQPQTVRVAAIDDSRVDGGDTKVFPPHLNTVADIQGPIYVEGEGGQGSLVAIDPVMLPGETNVKPPTGSVVNVTEDGSQMTVARGDILALEDIDFVQDLVEKNRTVEITEGPGIDSFRLIVDVEEVPAITGTAESGSATTLVDLDADFVNNYGGLGGFFIRITGGTGSGQVREIESNTAHTITVVTEWDTQPGTGSIYEIMARRTLEEGTAESATDDWLTDDDKIFDSGLVDDYIRITDGTGAGQVRRIVSVMFGSVQVDSNWDENPDETSVYEIFTLDEAVTLILNEPFTIDTEEGEQFDDIAKYAITKESLNFFANEVEQIDYLFVYNDDSLADNQIPSRAGLLADVSTTDLSGLFVGNGIVEEFVTKLDGKNLSGLGMGPELFIGNVWHPGGITFGDLEAVEINLGGGVDDFTVTDTQSRADGYQTWTIINSGDEPSLAQSPTAPADGDTVVVDLDSQIREEFTGSPTFESLAGSTTLYQSGAMFPTDGRGFEGYIVQIVSGAGAGQRRVIEFNTSDELTVDRPWGTDIDTTSVYRVVSSVITTGETDVNLTDTGPDSNKLTDTNPDDITSFDQSLVGKVLEITEGPGAGVRKEIIAVTGNVLTLSSDWSLEAGDPGPSKYRIYGEADGPISINAQGGDDTVDGTASTIPLVIFGGNDWDDGDTLYGGTADDIIFGDRGRIQYHDEEGKIVTLHGFVRDLIEPQKVDEASSTIDGATITDNSASFPIQTLEDPGLIGLMVAITDGKGVGQKRRIVGNDVTTLHLDAPWDEDKIPDTTSSYRISLIPEDQTDGVVREPALIITRDPAVGGSDTIYGMGGSDILIGGASGDNIFGDDDYGSPLLETADGSDIIAGDHVRIDLSPVRPTTLEDGVDIRDSAPTLLEFAQTIEFYQGSSDTISGNAGSDVIFGGVDGDVIYGDDLISSAGVFDGGDFIIGDNGEVDYIDGVLAQVRTTDTTDDTGGADTIHGNVGNDLILGGVNGSSDVIHGNEDANIIVGDNGEFLFDEDDSFGLTLDLSTLDIVRTTDTDLGGKDFIYGDAGDDIILGATGGDEIHGGTDNDLVLGDFGEIRLLNNVARFVKTKDFDPDLTDDTDGIKSGADVIYGDDDEDVLAGGDGADIIDGGSEDDLIFGDNIRLDRFDDIAFADFTSPRFRALAPDKTRIYDKDDNDNVNDSLDYEDPTGVPVWANWDIFIDDTAGFDFYDDDYIAGGAHDDTIFGQLGDDTIQGDGSIESKVDDNVATIPVGANRDTDGYLHVDPSFESATDGDDYIEGNSGNEVIFGNLGQDDIIGGSSHLFSLIGSELRPDDTDMIFGGAGTDISRNNLGDESAEGHARDADMILGDNGNVYRLVSVNTLTGTSSYLTFNYDDYTDGLPPEEQLKIIPRAAELLDYNPGGLDFIPDQDPHPAASDIGVADEVHGESGDDFIYGMKDSDILFGEGQDDDIIGGYGFDWISGGTGQDGVIGDDGRIYTSRNGTSEPLYGIGDLAGELDKYIYTPGKMQQATINISGKLKKTVNLTPFKLGADDTDYAHELFDPLYADDIIYGGWGGDFLHGGDGDDAISGAEALPMYYEAPFNPGNVLKFGVYRAGEFGAYDEYDPWSKVYWDHATGEFVTGGSVEFLLNFDHLEGPDDIHSGGTGFDPTPTDGDDRIFGDLGNDWLVGGTGKDNLYGGYGYDLLNADDDHTTNGGANDAPDTHPSYEDRAYGGAGRDYLIGNTGGDRLIDWAGEFNSYIVPFAPFGMATVSRTLQPQLREFLYDLSESDGADPTRATDTWADPLRNGEPYGELGLVIQKDFDWHDQTGAPDDPQPGNIPGGRRDVLRSASFNGVHSTTLHGFYVDTGVWNVENAALRVSAESLGGDAASVFHVDEVLPSYFEIQATITMEKPIGGWKANSYVIFNYYGPYDFKFAGLNASIDKIQMGHRDETGWQVDVQSNVKIKPGQYYNMLVAVHGTNVTLVANNKEYFSYTFEPRIIDGWVYGLNTGMVGFGSDNSRGVYDNIAVQVLPPEITLEETEDFKGQAELVFMPASGDWLVSGNRYSGTPEIDSTRAVSLVDLGLEKGLETASILELETTLNTETLGGVVFDYYGQDNFKFAAISAESNQVVIGHYTKKSGWVYDAVFDYAIEAGTDYELALSLKGTTVSISVKKSGAKNWQAMAGHVFNAVSVDGDFGLLSKDGNSSFDVVTVKTDDPAFRVEQEGQNLLASAAPQEPFSSEITLTYDELAPIVEEAIERWADATPIDDTMLAMLHEVTFQIVDLDGLTLGQVTDDGTVMIDIDAAGHGWFVDTTPYDDTEFRRQNADRELLATSSSSAYGDMDLLTVVMHELGHALGFEDLDPEDHPHDLMSSTLDVGVRRLDIRTYNTLPLLGNKQIVLRYSLNNLLRKSCQIINVIQ